jgi:hypothetical protein
MTPGSELSCPVLPIKEELCAKGRAADVAAAATRDSACITSRREDAEPCWNDVQVEAAVARAVASIAVVDKHLLPDTLLRRAASRRITRLIEGHHNKSSASFLGLVESCRKEQSEGWK